MFTDDSNSNIFLFKKQVCVERPSSTFNMTLPHLLLSAGACSTAPAAVDRYLLPAGRSAANPTAAVAAVDRRDRQTDGRLTVT